MKKILIAFAILTTVLSTFAGGPQIGSSLNGGTNNLIAAATSTFNLPGANVSTNLLPACSFFVGNGNSIYFQLSGSYANSSSTGNATATLQFVQSVDNVIWTNGPSIVLTMPVSTTNTALNYLLTVTNACPFYSVYTLISSTNGSGAGTLTNIYLKAFTKTGI